METSLQDTTHMTKKQIRIVLACTILLPVWVSIGIVFAIFPGIIAFFMGIGVMLFNSILWIGAENREECWEKIKTGIVMIFGIILIPVRIAWKYVEESKIEI